jgi:hypothetical protein
VISGFKISSVKKRGTHRDWDVPDLKTRGFRRTGSGLLEPRAAAPGLLFGFGLGKSAENFLAFLPAAVLLEEVDAFETLQDVSLFPDAAGGLQTGMLGHFKSP